MFTLSLLLKSSLKLDQKMLLVNKKYKEKLTQYYSKNYNLCDLIKFNFKFIDT